MSLRAFSLLIRVTAEEADQNKEEHKESNTNIQCVYKHSALKIY